MIGINCEKQSVSRFIMKTEGLRASGHSELQIEFRDSDLEKDAEDFLRHVSDHVLGCGVRLRPGETVRYGYWVTEFKAHRENVLEAWEYDASGLDLVKGVSLTLRYWKDQHSICGNYSAEFEPPASDEVSVVSVGVFEGLPVQGVRYMPDDQMSGWWITTNEYDGDINTLMNEHTYHLTAARPDLAKYLALPPGFRFDLSSFEDVWFDHEVLRS